MNECRVDKSPHKAVSVIGEDGFDWNSDVLYVVGEGLWIIRPRGSYLPKLECNHGDGWERAPRPRPGQAVFFPQGTYVRARGCTTDPLARNVPKAKS